MGLESCKAASPCTRWDSWRIFAVSPNCLPADATRPHRSPPSFQPTHTALLSTLPSTPGVRHGSKRKESPEMMATNDLLESKSARVWVEDILECQNMYFQLEKNIGFEYNRSRKVLLSSRSNVGDLEKTTAMSKAISMNNHEISMGVTSSFGQSNLGRAQPAEFELLSSTVNQSTSNGKQVCIF